MFWNKDLGSYDELVEVELKEMRRKIIPGVDKVVWWCGGVDKVVWWCGGVDKVVWWCWVG